MYKFILPLTLLFFTCGTPKNIEQIVDQTEDSTLTTTPTTPNLNTRLNILKYHPYCGGAAPRDDQRNNYSKVTGEFILINNSKNSKTTVKSINGVITLQLKPGSYSLRETYKNKSFKDFYAEHKKEDDKFYTNQSEDCYKTWWSTNLFEFEITDTTTLLDLKTTIQSRCFTGINPCIQYTGPYPP